MFDRFWISRSLDHIWIRACVWDGWNREYQNSFGQAMNTRHNKMFLWGEGDFMFLFSIIIIINIVWRINWLMQTRPIVIKTKFESLSNHNKSIPFGWTNLISIQSKKGELFGMNEWMNVGAESNMRSLKMSNRYYTLSNKFHIFQANLSNICFLYSFSDC